MKGTYQSSIYMFKFIDNNGDHKTAKVTASGLYAAKQAFNSRYKGKVKEFLGVDDLGWKPRKPL